MNIADNACENVETNTSAEQEALLSSNEIVLMQTARARVKCPDGNKEKEVRILLDSGSQRTYITEQLASYLGLKKEYEQEIRLVTFRS